MKKKTLFKLLCIFVLSLVFVGCNGVDGAMNGFGFFGGGDDRVGPEKKDNTGIGLKVDFNIKSVDKNTGRIEYELILDNSGVEPVKLTRDNFKLIFGRYDNKPVLVDESVEAFYKKVLTDDDTVTIYQNINMGTGGILKIDEGFLKSNVENFDLDLETTYPTKTEFFSNLDLKTKYDMYKISSGSTFEQAAPIQVNSLKLVPSYNDGEYILEVNIFDKGDSSSVMNNANNVDNVVIELNNFEMKFGEEDLKCKLKTVTDDESANTIKVKKNSNVVLECPVIIKNNGDFTTQITGSFDYDYSVKKSVSIDINSK